jgi:plastocyanin
MVLGLLLDGAACGSSSSGGGTGGAGGAAAAAGAGGAGGGSADDAGAFMPVAPCNSTDDYTVATSAPVGITFNNTLTYTPKCAKILPGWSVVFTGDATDFGVHPLFPSSSRGDAADNPITQVLSGTTSPVFTFSKPGFYGYYCIEHGTDSGSGMAGVVWVGGG